jgi:xanthine dehydrogenase large subunit
VKFGISFTLTHLNQAGALVHVYQDGSIGLNHGGTEMGQGLFQKVAQVAADRFGVGAGAGEDHRDRHRQGAQHLGHRGLVGQRSERHGGEGACDEIKTRMTAVPRPNAPGATRQVGSPTAWCMSAARPALRRGGAEDCYMAGSACRPRGSTRRPRSTGTGSRAGAAVLLLRLWRGCDRGGDRHADRRNRILRTDILHDCGASLNPALDIGQIEGGFVQGAGWLTTEELVWDERRAARTHAPSTYKIPACSDRPSVFNVALWDGREPGGHDLSLQGGGRTAPDAGDRA